MLTNKTMITVKQASDILKVSTQTLKRWEKQQKVNLTIYRHKVNNYRMYDMDEVKELAQRMYIE